MSLVGHSIICIHPCKVRRKISDTLFIYDILSNNDDRPKLLSMIGIVTHNYSIRSSSLFLCLLKKKKNCIDSSFQRALTLCDLICNEVDFFFVSRLYQNESFVIIFKLKPLLLYFSQFVYLIYHLI